MTRFAPLVLSICFLGACGHQATGPEAPAVDPPEITARDTAVFVLRSSSPAVRQWHHLCSDAEADSTITIVEQANAGYCWLQRSDDWRVEGTINVPIHALLAAGDRVMLPATAELRQCNGTVCTENVYERKAEAETPAYDLGTLLPESRYRIFFSDGLLTLEANMVGGDLVGTLQWQLQLGPNGFRNIAEFVMEREDD